MERSTQIRAIASEPRLRILQLLAEPGKHFSHQQSADPVEPVVGYVRWQHHFQAAKPCIGYSAGKGFEVVGVSFDNKLEAWKKGVNDLGLAWPQMSDLKGWQCAAHDAYGVNSIPSNVLLDPNGVIVACDLRAEDLLEKLAEIYK